MKTKGSSCSSSPEDIQIDIPAIEKKQWDLAIHKIRK